MRAGAGWVAQLVGVWSVILYTKKVACLIPVRVCAYGCNQSMFLSPLPSSSLLKSIIYPWVRIKKKKWEEWVGGLRGSQEPAPYMWAHLPAALLLCGSPKSE